jgi:hypothetical protein
MRQQQQSASKLGSWEIQVLSPSRQNKAQQAIILEMSLAALTPWKT